MPIKLTKTWIHHPHFRIKLRYFTSLLDYSSRIRHTLRVASALARRKLTSQGFCQKCRPIDEASFAFASAAVVVFGFAVSGVSVSGCDQVDGKFAGQRGGIALVSC